MTEDVAEDSDSVAMDSLPKATKDKPAKSKNLDGAASGLDIPLLGYRACCNLSHGYNTDTRFVSGLYQHAHQIPPCPEINDDFYKSEAEKHVAKNPSPSPFISLSGTPLRALVLAFMFQRRKFCTGSYLAIINLKTLHEDGVLQKAKDLKLRPKVKYSPANEFLVWGEIKREAIVSVINVAELIFSPPRNPYDDDPLAIKEICKHWRSLYVRMLIRRINRENQVFLSGSMGYAVGQFSRVLQLPQYCLKAFVDGIVEDWGLKCSRYERWADNEIFQEALQKGHDNVDISKSQLDTRSVMTIRVKIEELCPSVSFPPVIILSDDETDDGEAGPKAPIQGLHKEQAAPGLKGIEGKNDDVFSTLPTCYEIEMDIDRVDERIALRTEWNNKFALLGKAYENEMADLGP